MALSVIIIDDEPLALKLLAKYVSDHRELTLLAGFSNPIDGLEYLGNHTVDLLLLDIQMPELNGLHLARLVKGKCKIIFTTAYGEHALAGFELDAVDYLLKPITAERFQRAVAKVISAPGFHRRLMPNTDTPNHLLVKSGNRTVRLELDNLLYGSSSGDYLSLYLADGSKLLTLENLSCLVERLPATHFCRIHRSHFVALEKVDFVERRRAILGKVWLPVSDGYRETFFAAFNRS